MEDHEIIELLFARSEQAIRELDGKYGRLCRKVSYDILHDHEDTEECVNDTYMGVWNTIPPRRPDPLAAYVCRIAKNLSLKRYAWNRAKKRDSSLDLCYEELKECIPSGNRFSGGADPGEETDLKPIIEKFLSGLSRENRVLFVKRYWFAESVKEIAAEAGLSQNTVAVRLHRIRKKLKLYLEKEGVRL